MTSLALACRLGAVTAPRSIPRRVRAILNKYGATMLLPGVAEPILGPELVATLVPGSGAVLTQDANDVTAQLVGGDTFGNGNCSISVTAGKQYRIMGNIVSSTGTPNFGLSTTATGATDLLNLSSLGVKNQIYTATTTGSIFLQVGVSGANAQTFATGLSFREILGYSNTYASFQSGNYRESTGQTLAATDQQVGLVVDAARVPGPELRGGFVAQIAGSAAPATYNTATGAGTCNRVNVSNQSSIRLVGLLVGGRYAVSVTNTGLASVSVRTAAGAVILFSVASRATVVQTIVPQSIGDLVIQGGIDDTSCTFVVNSVRELPGIHASQSTSGFQPVVRRGLLNQLLWSSDFSNTAWSKNNSTYANGKLSANTAIAAHYIRRSYASSGAITVAVEAKAGSIPFIGIATNYGGASVSLGAYANISTKTVTRITSGYSSPSFADSSDGYVVFAVTCPANAFVDILTHTGADSVTTTGDVQDSESVDIYVRSAALFQGTVTAEEIIAAGGIPVTTSAPASSANGIQSWQFDGTDDRLSLSAVPFQMADDHFVVAGINPSSSASDPAIFSVTSTTNNNPVISLGLLGTGVPRMWWRDDAGTFIQRVADDNLSVVGSNVVLSGVKRGSTGRFRKNGIPRGSIALSLGAATFNAATVGAFTRSTVTSFLNGHIHGVIFGKGAITDSELLTLERFMATLQGRTL